MTKKRELCEYYSNLQEQILKFKKTKKRKIKNKKM